MEKMQPLKRTTIITIINFTQAEYAYLTIHDSESCVRNAKGNPNPMKYGQFNSRKANLLCNSHPMLNHLYSNAYSEYKRHMCTRDNEYPTT